ncbi:MAG: FG-GAP-like repeat-containing protein [Pseudomonadota bacterium]
MNRSLALALAAACLCACDQPAAPAPAPAVVAPATTPAGPFNKEVLATWSERHFTWYVEAGKLAGEDVVLLSESLFDKDAEGKPVPKPATLTVFTKHGAAWDKSELTDPEGAVFHKAILVGDALLTISGADPKDPEGRGRCKRWSHAADGTWSAQELWSQRWEGTTQRIRDLEIGDVDGDGQDEYVMATHDYGVVAVLELDGAVRELDPVPDIFVHEIEIGDIDGDGKAEFFATPSERNKADASQHGEIVMYRFDGESYVRSVVDSGEGTHAKEILATDVDGDGKAELFGVMEAALGPDKTILTPVQIRQYTLQPDGSFISTVIASIQDKQCRNLVAADFDHDGREELVAAAIKTGLYLIDTQDGQSWTVSNFESQSAGFEHAANAEDADGDGNPELYVVSDDHKTLARYTWGG